MQFVPRAPVSVQTADASASRRLRLGMTIKRSGELGTARTRERLDDVYALLEASRRPTMWRQLCDGGDLFRKCAASAWRSAAHAAQHRRSACVASPMASS